MGHSDDAVRSDEDVLFRNYPTASSGMHDDGRPQADLYRIIDFNTFRVFVLEIRFISNTDLSINLDASKAVEKRTKRGRTG